MSKDEHETMFQRALEARRLEVVKAANALINAVGAKSTSTNHLSALEVAADNLSSMLDESDIPGWCRELRSICRLFGAGSHRGDYPEIFSRFTRATNAAKSHKWEFGVAQVPGIEFDVVFDEAVKNSRVPELLDRLIDLLEQCVEADELDSKRLDEALRRVIRILKANRRPSYSSAFLTRDFLFSVAGRWVFGELEKLPGIGTLVSAIRETVAEYDRTVNALPEAARPKLESEIATEFPALPAPQADSPTAETSGGALSPRSKA